MSITFVPFAAEHAQALPGLMGPEEVAQIVAHPDVLRYRAVLDENICVGIVGLQLVGDPQIVVAIAYGQRQKGYATVAVREMVRYAFDEVGLPRVYATCLTGRPSNKVVAKAGFTFVVEQGQERYYELRKVNWEAAQQAAVNQVAAGPVAQNVDVAAENSDAAPKDESDLNRGIVAADDSEAGASPTRPRRPPLVPSVIVVGLAVLTALLWLLGIF